MKKYILITFAAIITICATAQTKSDSLIFFTKNLETVSQREQANLEYLEDLQSKDTTFSTLVIIHDKEYKHIRAQMSFPEGSLYNGAIVRFETLDEAQYGNVAIGKHYTLYGRAYLSPQGRVFASATHSNGQYICFDLYDSIDFRLGTILNAAPGWFSSLNSEITLEGINLFVAKAKVSVKKDANKGSIISINPKDKFDVILIANYSI